MSSARLGGMPVLEKDASVVVFQGWMTQFTAGAYVLEFEDLFERKHEDNPEEIKLNKLAILTLMKAISSEVAARLPARTKTTTFKTLWDAVCNMFGRVDTTIVRIKRNEMAAMRFNDKVADIEDAMKKHIDAFDAVYVQYKRAGGEQKDDMDAKGYLIDSLPTSFDSLRHSLNTNIKTISYEAMQSYLKSEAALHKSSSNRFSNNLPNPHGSSLENKSLESVLVAALTRANFFNHKKPFKKKKKNNYQGVQCHKCKRFGHIKAQCKAGAAESAHVAAAGVTLDVQALRQSLASLSSSVPLSSADRRSVNVSLLVSNGITGSALQAAMASIQEVQPSQGAQYVNTVWVEDSGASSFGTSDKGLFRSGSFEAFDKEQIVFTANEAAPIHAIGKGTVDATSSLGHTLALEDTLLFKEDTPNLFSVRAACKQGLEISFKGEHSVVRNAEGTPVAAATCSGLPVYVMQFAVKTQSSAASATTALLADHGRQAAATDAAPAAEFALLSDAKPMVSDAMLWHHRIYVWVTLVRRLRRFCFVRLSRMV